MDQIAPPVIDGNTDTLIEKRNQEISIFPEVGQDFSN